MTSVKVNILENPQCNQRDMGGIWCCVTNFGSVGQKVAGVPMACRGRLMACQVRACGVPCVRQGTRVACHPCALAGYDCTWSVPVARLITRHLGRVQWRAHSPPPVAREGGVANGRATHFLIHCTRVSPFLFPLTPMADWLLLSMSKCILLTKFYLCVNQYSFLQCSKW